MENNGIAGIDFGTSNSLVAIAKSADIIETVSLNNNKSVAPTALFFGDKKYYGTDAVQAYLSGTQGRFMRGMKSLLNAQTEINGTTIDGRFVSFADLIKTFICFLKEKADTQAQQPLQSVVMGRPVHFCTDEQEDKAAENTLQKICYELGFKNVGFQYEPIAAALHYEHQIETEELTLVADLGGGTSDFSVIRLNPKNHKNPNREKDVLSNDSVHLAGTDLDRLFAYHTVMPHFGRNEEQKNGLPIPASFYFAACTWHEIRKMYTPRHILACKSILRNLKNPDLFERYLALVQQEKGHSVLFETEKAKITLSEKEQAQIDLTELESDFYISVLKQEFLQATREVCTRILAKAEETLTAAGVSPAQIKNIIFTGGTSLVPSLSDGIKNLCPEARVKQISTFSAVGEGLALDAFHRFG